MSHGLGRMQRLILDALEPSQQICRRPQRWNEERHAPPCIPDLCYGWLGSGTPWLRAQLPLDVYDLEDVRRVVVVQEKATWPPVPPAPKPWTPERVAWALAQIGQPHDHALRANIARALRSLLDRGDLVACHTIPLVRYEPPGLGWERTRHPFVHWVVEKSEEEATLFYPYERRVRFVTRGTPPKC